MKTLIAFLLLAVTGFAQVQARQNVANSRSFVTDSNKNILYKTTTTPTGNYITMPNPGHSFRAYAKAVRPGGQVLTADTGYIATNNPVNAIVTVPWSPGHIDLNSISNLFCPVGQFTTQLLMPDDGAEEGHTKTCMGLYPGTCVSNGTNWQGSYTPVANCTAPTCPDSAELGYTPKAGHATCDPTILFSIPYIRITLNGQLQKICYPSSEDSRPCNSNSCGDYPT